MLALRSSPPSFGAAEGERIARDLYGLAPDVRRLPGERDCNFHLRTADAREFVLKISSLSDVEGTDCLVAALDHLAEQGADLPVPRLFPTLTGTATGRVSRDDIDCAACLVSYLPGRVLADAYADTPGTARARLLQGAGEMLARLDHALQGFFHPALNRRLAWDVRRLPELAVHLDLVENPRIRSVIEAVAIEFHEALPRIRGLRSQAIHGDGHAANLLVDGAGAVSGILDFGDMIHAPAVLEPAIAMSELLTNGVAPVEAVSAVLAGYARRQRLTERDLSTVYDLVCARHASALLVHAWRRRHDPQGARALETTGEYGADSLLRLTGIGRQQLTQEWREAARMGAREAAGPGNHGEAASSSAAAAKTASSVDLARRQRLMGRGAELFYERPLHLVRGSGVWLYDPEGRAYLDVYNNVSHVGHAHPHVVEAIQRQVAMLATHSRYLHAGILDYAERLTARLPKRLDTCIFVNSGSEANDVAWRIAQLATGRSGALVMENAYHGITDAVAALTPSTGVPRDARVLTIPPPPPNLDYRDGVLGRSAAGPRAGGDDGARAGGDDGAQAQEGDALAAAAAAAEADVAIARLRERGFEPAAFYLDTAITSSGVFDPRPAWGRALTGRLREAGAIIVADEVQYGLGRPGSHFWGFERRGIDPDIVTLGKPVANGFPMGVVAANRSLIEALQAKFGFFSTFGGNAVAAAAGTAVLEVLDRERLMANAAATGDYARGRLEAIASRHPAVLGQVRGAGLLLGLEVRGADIAGSKRRTKRIINFLAAEKRILIGYEGPHATLLKLRPPMPFQREHVDMLANAIDEAAGWVMAGSAS
ncbi:MAG TPA: aminotransferase class III-fold pyridoxal phosphate-dependent enzyme [Steroidobacteraceae bacterium]|nr:aminotransferase class III-fold pyridoxal phosphate-dependent enzyme [Steroidobacteraceae bacterium]